MKKQEQREKTLQRLRGFSQEYVLYLHNTIKWVVHDNNYSVIQATQLDNEDKKFNLWTYAREIVQRMKERNNYCSLTLIIGTKNIVSLFYLDCGHMGYVTVWFLCTATRGHRNPDVTIGLLDTVQILNLIRCLLFTVVLPYSGNLLHPTTAKE